jgi:hypothetical protein
MPQLTKKLASVVLLGTFDLRSFTPTALLGKEVLSVAEAVEVDALTLLPGRTVSYELKSFKASIQTNRIQLEALTPPYIRVVDVVSKTLRDNPDFPTKITHLGINLNSYYMLDDFASRDRLGRRLAPLEGWGRWSEQLKRAADFPPEDRRHSGMMSITMRLPMRDDRPSGWIDVKVEPSVRQEPAPEVFININDHYEFGEEKDKDPSVNSAPLMLLEIAETRFDNSLHRSEEIVTYILDQAK